MDKKEFNLLNGVVVISEESRRHGIVVFQAFAELQLSEKVLKQAQKIWPRY